MKGAKWISGNRKSRSTGSAEGQSSMRLEKGEPYLSQETMPGIICRRSQCITMSRGRIPVRENESRAAKEVGSEIRAGFGLLLLLYWGGMAGIQDTKAGIMPLPSS